MIARTAEEAVRAGEELGKSLRPGAIVRLTGPLGAGKTTFTKGIARALGIAEEVTSPTYTLISEYRGTMPLYHMDLYRLGSAEEFELLGVEEMLYGRGVSVIEWSERAESVFPEDAIRVTIGILPDGSREIVVSGVAA